MDINKKYLDVVVNHRPQVAATPNIDPEERNNPGWDDMNFDPDLEPEDNGLTGRQQAEAIAYITIVKKFGPYNQGPGPDGSHYELDNDGAPEGICCQNCIFYEGGGKCDITAGVIDPLGLCDRYIIPLGAQAANGLLIQKREDPNPVYTPGHSE